MTKSISQLREKSEVSRGPVGSDVRHPHSGGLSQVIQGPSWHVLSYDDISLMKL